MKYIDQNEIYRATDNGYAIFEHYFPGVDLKNVKKFIKVRSTEKTASAKITFYKGLYRITDFGNQSEINGMNAISFVIYMENLIYNDALEFIQSVIIGHEISCGEYKKPQHRATYEMREMTPSDQKGQYNFTFKEKVTEDDCQVIGRYVTPDLLKKFCCKVVEKYEYCSHSKKLNRDVVHIFSANKDFPIFLFDYNTFKKLYKPLEIDKKHRFQYIGEKPKDFIYGLKQLQEIDSEFIILPDEDNPDANILDKTPENRPDAVVKNLFRCSGESDALNVASLGNHVYWLNSESAELNSDTYYIVDQLCECHFQIMDLDKTGHKMAMKFGLQHISLFTLSLPEWISKKKDWRGKPCKDAKDFINLAGRTIEETSMSFLVLQRRAMPMKFWVKVVTKKNTGDVEIKYNINLEYLYHFLAANGFYSMDSSYHKSAGYCYAYIQGKIVELISPEDIKKRIKRFIKAWIRSKNLLNEIELLNKINSSQDIKEANLQELNHVELEFKNYTRKAEILVFKNKALRITKDKIECIKHEELPNFVLGKLVVNKISISHFIDKQITLINKPPIEVNYSEIYVNLMAARKAAKNKDEQAVADKEFADMKDFDMYDIKINDDSFFFIKFLRNISRLHWRKEMERNKALTEDEKKIEHLMIANIMFSLGFLCSEYKDPGKPWMVFLQDMLISEVGKSAGRSGKSLISSAVKYVRASFYREGRNIKILEGQFLYDGFTKFHNVIEIDDLNQKANLDLFYSQITGNRVVDSKYNSAETIEYDESGKMLISSNFELQNTDSSTLARLLNCGVSDYYHQKTKYNDYKETRSPLLEFNRRLYDDFTDEEWNQFYNFIAYCIQLQQRFFKIQPPMGNLEKRQLRRDMTKGLGQDEEFFTWASNYIIKAPDSFKGTISPASSGYFNRLFRRADAFEDFQKTLNPKQISSFKAVHFKRAMHAWCDYYDFEFNPMELLTDKPKNGKGGRIMKNNEEFFFIRTMTLEELAEEGVHDEDATQEDLPF